MRRLGFAFLSLSFLPLDLACQGLPPPESAPAPNPPWFEDVTDKVWLHFLHDPGPVGTYFMPQQVGSGAALFDFDNDGLLDVLLLQNGGPESKSTNRLFRQRPDHTFVDVSAGSGLDFAGHNMGVAIGDVNNDGWPDVLVTQYCGVRLLLNNNGNGIFRDVTAEAGLDNPGWGTSAAFFDYDRDGWLDLVVVNYVDYDRTWPCKGPYGQRDFCAPKTFRGRVSRLFHNLGRAEAPLTPNPSPPGGEGRTGPLTPNPSPPRGRGEEEGKPLAPRRGERGWGEGVPAVRFADVTETSGLGRLPGPGLGVVCADFDGDGWPDIFIANDGAANHLWINQKDGTFKEEAALRGVDVNGMGQAQAGMGIAWGDVDGDGLLDLFVTHLTEEGNTLWQQGPRGLFQDRSALAGLLKPVWPATGFGTLLADFDNDGWLDLVVVNGRVSARAQGVDESLGPFWSRYGDRNQVFANDGRGRFRDISLSNPELCGRYNLGRGAVRGDFDGDGAEDLLVTSIAGPARLFRNRAPGRGHWLRVRTFDPALHRDALGSEVRVRAGGRTRVAWMHPAESYLCSSEPRAHFGLGAADRIESIDVLWPDGTRETFPGGQADRCRELRKGEGRSPPK
jgi:hypothetical protein